MQIYFYISLIGVLIASYLVYFNLRRNPSILYLGAFFFFLSLYSLSNFVLYRSQSVFWISLFYVNFGHFAYLIGPFSFLYVRSIITDNSKIKYRDLLHLIPFGISILFSLPYILTEHSQKEEIAIKIANDYRYLFTYHPTILSDFISNFLIFMSRPVHIFIYSILNFRVLINYQKGEHYKRNGEKIILKWLFTFSISLLLVVVFYSFAMYIHLSKLSVDLQTFMSYFEKTTIFVLLLLMISPTLYPRILYGLPYEIKLHPENDDKNFGTTEKALKSNLFDEEYLEDLFNRLSSEITSKKLYTNSSLNLKELSGILNVPEYHLKYLFSTHKQLFFKDFCNSYRINYAKELIKSPKYKSMTLEAIALASGFSNRNSFTKNFQKYEGINPSEFVCE